MHSLSLKHRYYLEGLFISFSILSETLQFFNKVKKTERIFVNYLFSRWLVIEHWLLKQNNIGLNLVTLLDSTQ